MQFRPVFAILIGCLLSQAAHARQENPVYVDDSPQAWELFRQAIDQSADNQGQAARLYQQLLDEYRMKLIPIDEIAPNHFQAVRLRVLRELMSNRDLLHRYRIRETAEAARLLAAGDLSTLAATRSLTAPGLEGLLRLAQQELEAARFFSAINYLREALEHPDLTESQAAHAWFMIGMAAGNSEEAQQLAAALNTLEGLGRRGTEMANELRTLFDNGTSVPVRKGVSTLDVSGASDLRNIIAHPIWSVPLPESLLNRRYPSSGREVESENPAYAQLRDDASLNAAVPTATRDTVYVNQGHHIAAFDRYTGQSKWPRAYVERSLMNLDNRDERLFDLNAIAIHGDRLVTLTGHASASRRSNNGKILCLDANTGSWNWHGELEDIDGLEAHEDIYPHGEPIIAEESVFVLARRVTPQSLTNCYVVALELNTGALRWIRFIGSSGALRKNDRSISTLTHVDGELYVASHVGTIARLDAGTGQVRWLRRFSVRLSPTRLERRPWEVHSPVIFGHAVIALRPDEQRVVVLDRETGDTLQTAAAGSLAEAWGEVRYLLAGNRGVYSIGRDIRAFQPNNWGQPLWQFPHGTSVVNADGTIDQESIVIRGRVQAITGALVVPTSDGIYILDDETGKPLQHIPTSSVGNPLALNGQILLAGSDVIESYVSFESAQLVLRQRIAESSDDPDAAIALLRLGLRVRSLPLALEAADIATRIIDSMPPGRQERERRAELFAILVDIGREGMADTIEQGELLYATIGEVATEPAQKLEHRFAYSTWILDHSRSSAVEALQSILSDPLLAEAWYEQSGIVQTGAAWTTERLRELIAEHGDSVYRPQAEFAQMQLQQLLDDLAPDAQRFSALAREYALAPAGVDAALAAADSFVSSGRHRHALSILFHVYRANPSPARARTLLGAALGICSERDWHQEGYEIARLIRQEEGDITVRAGSIEQPVSAWSAVFNRGGLRNRVPDLGDEGAFDGALEADHHLGQLVPLALTATRPIATDRALILNNAKVSMLTSPDLTAAWDAAVDDRSPELLALDNDQAMLWLDASKHDPRAEMYDAVTGVLRWTTPPLAELVTQPIAGLDDVRRMPNGQPFETGEWLPLVNQHHLVLVQRTGGIVAFNLEDGSRTAWTRNSAMSEVHYAVLTDSSLILTGFGPPPGGASRQGTTVPLVMILDPANGFLLHRLEPIGSGGVTWLAPGPLGTLAFATNEGIEAMDLLTGQRRWANQTYLAMETARAWSSGNRVIVEDRFRNIRAMELAAGRLSAEFSQPPGRDWQSEDLVDLHFFGDDLYAQYRDRIVAYSMRGNVVGSDAVAEERDYRWLIPTRHMLLAIAAGAEQRAVPEETRTRTFYAYTIFPLSRDCRLIGQAPSALKPVVEAVWQVRAIDGWLLMSTPTSTYALDFRSQR